MDMEESRLIRFTNLAGGALKSIQALKGMKMAPYGLSGPIRICCAIWPIVRRGPPRRNWPRWR